MRRPLRLAAGTRIGPYEVVAPLGSGGMGEVFRARDARLKRDVALKVLRLSAVGEAERLPRFEREAQVLASLNHPAIAQVFGIESHDGSPVIVMELVEGPTLAERLKKGALPIDDALSIATQLCDGLEAAHERGVIHRDLKPANIKARQDGTIKILDFGIARVLTSDTPVEPAESPTILTAGTDLGVLLGTAAYMSPEQARGRPVDKRADIWAFGCLLYEMATGKAAFTGETTTDILADIVRKDPDWNAVPPSVPDRIVDLLRHCLQKNPKDRLRDIGDARFEIQSASATRSGRNPAAVRSTAPAPAIRRLVPALAAFAAGAGAAGIIMFVAAPRSAAPEAAAVTRTSIELPPDTTVALSRGSDVILSPNGRVLVFAGHSKSKTQLYLRPLDRFESQPIAGTEDASNPFFSPDGRWIGFFAAGKLKKVSLDGGAPVTLADAGAPRGEAWGPDDAIYMTPNNNSGVVRVPAGGGKADPATTLEPGELSHRWPRALPDGSAILFTIWNDSGFEPSRIAAQPFGGQRKIVVEAGGGYGRYIRDTGRRGFLVYARSEGLLAAPFDETRLATTGQSVPVVDGVVTNLSGGAHFDLSPSGTLAYVAGAVSEAERQLVWVTADRKVTPVMSAVGISRTYTLSSDGTRLLRSNTAGSTRREMWIENLVAHTTTRLSDPQDTFNPIWSPDSKWVTYAKGVPNSNIYRRPADGRDVEERITTAQHPQLPVSYSPDGKWLVYEDYDPVAGGDLWIVDVPPTTPPRPFVKTNFIESWPHFSPDGRWIAYQSNESGRYEVYVRSFPDGERTARISTDGGISPIWSRSGTEIYYIDTKTRMMATPVKAGAEFQVSTARLVFDAVGYEGRFAVSPDSERFLMMPLIGSDRAPTQIHLVFNFLNELRQRVR